MGLTNKFVRPTKKAPVKSAFLNLGKDGLFEAILLAELVDAARGIYNLLLAGIKRVALGTDFNRQVFTCG